MDKMLLGAFTLIVGVLSARTLGVDAAVLGVLEA